MEIILMSLPHAVSGEPFNIPSALEPVEKQRARALVKTDHFEAIVVQLAKGQTMPEHGVDGPLTVHGLSGTVRFTMNGKQADIAAHDWMYLDGGTAHTVEALEDCVFLLTIVFTG
jgi:quercetin dioxygenase-like cupin family protein